MGSKRRMQSISGKFSGKITTTKPRELDIVGGAESGESIFISKYFLRKSIKSNKSSEISQKIKVFRVHFPMHFNHFD